MGVLGLAARYCKRSNSVAGQPDFVASHNHAAGGEVDLQAAGFEQRRRGFRSQRRAAQPGTDARQQFLHAERLGHVIVGAGIQGADLVLFHIADRQDDDGQIPAGANRTAGFQAAHAGHRQIQQHQIVPVAAQHVQGLFTAAASFTM
jgi:hypothetical protein